MSASAHSSWLFDWQKDVLPDNEELERFNNSLNEAVSKAVTLAQEILDGKKKLCPLNDFSVCLEECCGFWNNTLGACGVACKPRGYGGIRK